MLSLPISLALALAGPQQAAGAAPTEQATAEPRPPAEVTLLRLYEGSILWGRLADHDSQGILFERLDNGGRVRLPWSRLDPPQAEQMQEALGYVDHSEEEYMIEADRLVLNDGSEQVGRIVNRTEAEIWLKTANAVIPIPKLRLRGAATVVQVPALDVYTGEELYQQELLRMTADDAPTHYELARFCERILEYEHAVEHYQRAAELDPTWNADELANRLARAEERAANLAQVQYLREIDTLRGRGRYDEALDKAGTFEQVFPESPLARDAARKAIQVERARDAALAERTPRYWHEWAGRLAQAKGRESELSLESAIGWADEQMSEEVLAAVHRQLVATVTATVTPEQVRRLWVERRSGSSHKASYGEGTWLLGPDGARAGIPVQPEDLTGLNETERERKKLEERVRRYLQSQTVSRMKSKAGGGEEAEDERQTFWERWTALERKQWLLAYYAEKSGDMRVVRFDLTACKECGGSGVREVINLNAAPTRPDQQGGRPNAVEKVACPLCHNVGVVRRVVYR